MNTHSFSLLLLFISWCRICMNKLQGIGEEKETVTRQRVVYVGKTTYTDTFAGSKNRAHGRLFACLSVSSWGFCFDRVHGKRWVHVARCTLMQKQKQQSSYMHYWNVFSINSYQISIKNSKLTWWIFHISSCFFFFFSSTSLCRRLFHALFYAMLAVTQCTRCSVGPSNDLWSLGYFDILRRMKWTRAHKTIIFVLLFLWLFLREIRAFFRVRKFCYLSNGKEKTLCTNFYSVILLLFESRLWSSPSAVCGFSEKQKRKNSGKKDWIQIKVIANVHHHGEKKRLKTKHNK